MASENNLKRVQVKCHGEYKTSIKADGQLTLLDNDKEGAK